MEEHKILQDINNLNSAINHLTAEKNIIESRRKALLDQLAAFRAGNISKYSIVEIEDHIWFVVKIGDTVKEIEFYDTDIQCFEDIDYSVSSLAVIGAVIHTVDKETFTSELCKYLKNHHQNVLSKFGIDEEIS